ncbi:MAG: hypothetical protein ACRCT8_04735 [Lacipirellulaceae bacterium]
MNGDLSADEAAELESLVADLVDGGARPERVRALQALLLDRPDLQRRYARLIAVPMLLKTELSATEPSFGPLVASPSLSLDVASLAADDPCELLIARIARSEAGRDSRMRSVLWATAAAILVACVTPWVLPALTGPVRTAGGPVPGAPVEGPSNGSPSASVLVPETRSAGDLHRLVVRDRVSLTLVSRLTRTALLSSIALPTTPALGSAATPIVRGDVMLDNVAGQRERGFLVSVFPGHTLEMVVDANSFDENSLAVVELDAEGKTTGESVCFANTNESARLKARGNVRVVGTWSVRNSTDRPRSFLLTGSHKRFVATEDPNWYLSDYRVTYQSPSLLCIGWDDSGYMPQVDAKVSEGARVDRRGLPEVLRSALDRMEETDFLVQRDYDDVSATIRIYPTEAPAGPGLGLPYAARPRRDGPQADPAWLAEASGGYRFSVPPGAFAVVRATAQCLLPNTVAIIDVGTRRVVWSDTPEQRDPEQGPNAYSNYVLGLRGACIINNQDSRRHDYIVVGRNSMTEPDSPYKWSVSKHREVATFADGALVGFEDSLEDGDWNDLEVHVRVFKP